MNPVGWFEIYVDDMERAQKFYETVLAVKLEVLESPVKTFDNFSSLEMRSFPSSMDKYGATGALVKLEEISAGKNSTLVYFSCKDCAVEESRIKDAGGNVKQSKFSIGEHGFISIAVDTEGNMFGLHSLH